MSLSLMMVDGMLAYQPGGIPGAELGFYADGYSFDNTLNLDAGYGFGSWFGVPC